MLGTRTTEGQASPPPQGVVNRFRGTCSSLSIFGAICYCAVESAKPISCDTGYTGYRHSSTAALDGEKTLDSTKTYATERRQATGENQTKNLWVLPIIRRISSMYCLR